MFEPFKHINKDWERYFFFFDRKENDKKFLLKLAIILHNPNSWFIILYRVESYLYTNPNIFLKRFGQIIYPLYFYISYFIFDIHLNPNVKIDSGLYLHYRGIIISSHTKAGKNLSLIGPLTIGTALEGFKSAIIGNDVTICTGAKIIGDINIGNHVVVGANAVVVKNVPNNVIIGGVPAKILKHTTNN